MQRVLLLKNKTAQQDRYESTFLSHGFDPVFVPLITHTHVPQDLLVLLQDSSYLAQLQNIIVTSQRTVECLYESVLPQLDSPTKQALLQKTVYAVGSSTGDFLKRIGFMCVKGGSEAGNGSILADIISSDISDHDPKPEPLLLVGEVRKDIIPRKLSSNGIPVKEVVTYKTANLPDNLARFQKHAIEGSWVVFFSPQGTQDIITSIKEDNYKIASIGPTTERFLQEQGIQPRVVSLKPDEQNLVNAILSSNFGSM